MTALYTSPPLSSNPTCFGGLRTYTAIFPVFSMFLLLIFYSDLWLVPGTCPLYCSVWLNGALCLAEFISAVCVCLGDISTWSESLYFLCCHGCVLCVRCCWLMGATNKEGITQGHSIVWKDGGVIYKLLVATPASGISPHNTCCGCQDFSTHHTSAVTVRPRITTRTKQHRDTFFYSLFYRLLNVQVQQKLFCVVRYFSQCSQ